DSPAGPPGNRRNLGVNRRLLGASRRRLRCLPLRHRYPQAQRAHLEEGVLSRRRRLGRRRNPFRLSNPFRPRRNLISVPIPSFPSIFHHQFAARIRLASYFALLAVFATALLARISHGGSEQ